MKIRIEDNSVRYRLRKTEVEQLAKEGNVCCLAQFPEAPLEYCLKLDPFKEQLSANFSHGRITVILPEAWGLKWPSSTQVGFEGVLPLQEGSELQILVEKDFVCLDRDLSTQKDQYPHPKG